MYIQGGYAKTCSELDGRLLAPKAPVAVHVLAVPVVEAAAADPVDVNVGHLDVVAAAAAGAAAEVARLLDVVVDVDGAGDAAPGQVLQLEAARVAVLAHVARVVLALPGEEGRLAQAVDAHVLDGDVGGGAAAAAAAAAVGGKPRATPPQVLT